MRQLETTVLNALDNQINLLFQKAYKTFNCLVNLSFFKYGVQKERIQVVIHCLQISSKLITIEKIDKKKVLISSNFLSFFTFFFYNILINSIVWSWRRKLIKLVKNLDFHCFKPSHWIWDGKYTYRLNVIYMLK